MQCNDIKFEKDKAVGLHPINKQSHLKHLATINQVNKSISILKSKPRIKRSMWSRRAQEYEQKITSGKIYDLAEVVRDFLKVFFKIFFKLIFFIFILFMIHGRIFFYI